MTNDQIDQAVEIIRQRVNGIGVAEAEVTTPGSGANATIVVSVPGKKPERRRRADQPDRPAELPPGASQEGSGTVVAVRAARRRPPAAPRAGVEASTARRPEPLGVERPSRSPSPDGLQLGAAPEPSHTRGAATSAGSRRRGHAPASKQAADRPRAHALPGVHDAIDCTDPANRSGLPGRPRQLALVTCERDGSTKYLLEPAAVLGTDIDGASATINPHSISGEWVVNLDFDAEGTKAFADITKDLVDNPPPTNQFAIVLDGLVVSAPQRDQRRSSTATRRSPATSPRRRPRPREPAEVRRPAAGLRHRRGRSTISPTLGHRPAARGSARRRARPVPRGRSTRCSTTAASASSPSPR